MNVIIAEDDATTLTLMEERLKRWGYVVETTSDGLEAWEKLTHSDVPVLGILDWMLPGMTGVDICRKISDTRSQHRMHLILLTSKCDKQDMLDGLASGADDYLKKPCDFDELHARLKVGERILALESVLDGRLQRMQFALDKANPLRGLVPICMYCKSVRDQKNIWLKMETFFSERSDLSFSHGICPECFEQHIQPELRLLQNHDC